MDKIKESMKLIDEEIEWCNQEYNPDFNFTEEYKKGFISGLGQAKYLIQKLFFKEV